MIMKKLESVSGLVKLIESKCDAYSFRTCPKFVKITPSDDIKSIVKKEFEHLPIAPGEIDASYYKAMAYAIFKDGESPCIEFESKIEDDIAEKIYDYFFSDDSIFYPNISAVKFDIFKADSFRHAKLDENHYLFTVLFYGV